MIRASLFTKTLLLIIILFGIIATGTSILAAWNQYRNLTREYQSKGVAIAKSIAQSSVELLLNADVSTIQSVVDQFTEIEGVSYVIVFDSKAEAISHTFVPTVPGAVLELQRQIRSRAFNGGTSTNNLHIEGMGDFLDVAAPILAGVAGSVHVGMDRALIRSRIWSAVATQQELMFVIFLLSVLAAYAFVKRISQPLKQLAAHAGKLATQNFSEPVTGPSDIDHLPKKSQDEVGKLAGSFITMEHALRQSVRELKETTAAKERIESELKIAHDIQMSMVPKTFPPFPNRPEFDLYATLVPAREVGGDFYDFFFIDDNHLCLAIGDVSGKGIPAALFMAVTRALFRTTASKVSGPDKILSLLNLEMCRNNDACMFVTVFCAVLDIRTGEVEYSNGGHNLPYLISHGETAPLKNTGGMALGFTEDVTYRSEKIVLRAEDGLFLYTDGVTEAMDEAGNQFSEPRLEEFLHQTNDWSVTELVRGAVDQVRHHAAGAAQSDDITALTLKYLLTAGETTSEAIVVELKNSLPEIERIVRIADDFVRRHQLDAETSHNLKVALDEILTNIISYAYADGGEHSILTRFYLKQGKLTVEVEDDGRPFNPLDAPKPDTKQPLEQRTIGGLGIHFVRKLMEELEYRRQNDRNILIMKLKLKEA
ncbi:MAG TPA: SpoIIE family protein phosphatase [Candidatus Binatia bacterium]|nr:SpoIIE family protein phosphatase [Candidatus Binatia bacterium]